MGMTIGDAIEPDSPRVTTETTITRLWEERWRVVGWEEGEERRARARATPRFETEGGFWVDGKIGIAR